MSFQKQLQTNNAEAVRQFLAELPQQSANEGLHQAGEAFGFPTVEAEGVRYMLGRDLAQYIYGYKNVASLHHLLKQYGRELLSLRGSDISYQNLIRQAFSLSPSDGRSTLATWGDLVTFLQLMKKQQPPSWRNRIISR